MKKLIKKALTRQHKVFSSRERPKNIEEEEDISAFRKFVDKENLSVFQRLIRKILPVTDEYLVVYDYCFDEWFQPKHPVIQFYYNCRCRVIDFFDIPQHCRRIYWFFQRGFRGWSNRDIWSLDHYLCEWLPEAFAKLKKDKIGTPIGCYPEGPEYVDEKHGGANEIADKIAQERWSVILQKVIDGFAAKRKINNGDCPYEEPIRDMFKSRSDYWREFKKHDAKVHKWEKEQRVIFREGMTLFVKHFEDFWD